jgi:hypothetical protein
MRTMVNPCVPTVFHGMSAQIVDINMNITKEEEDKLREQAREILRVYLNHILELYTAAWKEMCRH